MDFGSEKGAGGEGQPLWMCHLGNFQGNFGFTLPENTSLFPEKTLGKGIQQLEDRHVSSKVEVIRKGTSQSNLGIRMVGQNGCGHCKHTKMWEYIIS